MGWNELIYDESLSRDERRDLYEEFVEEMAVTARAALEASELDADEYEVVTADTWASVYASGWEMTDPEDAKVVRDVLLGSGFVEMDDVGVFVAPRTIDGETAPLPPDAGGYSVEVKLHKDEALATDAIQDVLTQDFPMRR